MGLFVEPRAAALSRSLSFLRIKTGSAAKAWQPPRGGVKTRRHRVHRKMHFPGRPRAARKRLSVAAKSNQIQIVAAITFPDPRIESDGNNPFAEQLHVFTYLHCGARAAIC